MRRDPDHEFVTALHGLSGELGRPATATEVEKFLDLPGGEAARMTMPHLLEAKLICPVGRDIEDLDVELDAYTEEPLVITRAGLEYLARPPLTTRLRRTR